jgi:alpha-mannosidase
VEQKFFSMWWGRQNDAVKDSVRFLVANKQLNFVNGGWCMHDEASTHYMGMIDQTTLGHSFLKKELGVIPTVGWQLDPFGHSATQASLMTAKVGFDAIYFGRIDYQDLRVRQLEQECEGLWNGSRSLNDTTVFWELTGSHNGNYGSPRGFCFDVNCDDPSLIGMNSSAVMNSVKDFLRKIRVQSDQTKGRNIMLTMGSDFQVCLSSRQQRMSTHGGSQLCSLSL